MFRGLGVIIWLQEFLKAFLIFLCKKAILQIHFWGFILNICDICTILSFQHVEKIHKMQKRRENRKSVFTF